MNVPGSLVAHAHAHVRKYAQPKILVAKTARSAGSDMNVGWNFAPGHCTPVLSAKWRFRQMHPTVEGNFIEPGSQMPGINKLTSEPQHKMTPF